MTPSYNCLSQQKNKFEVKGDDVIKLTKKEICALFLAYFAVKEGVNKKSKGDISYNLIEKHNLTLINSYRSINMIYNP